MRGRSSSRICACTTPSRSPWSSWRSSCGNTTAACAPPPTASPSASSANGTGDGRFSRFAKMRTITRPLFSFRDGFRDPIGQDHTPGRRKPPYLGLLVPPKACDARYNEASLFAAPNGSPMASTRPGGPGGTPIRRRQSSASCYFIIWEGDV